MGKKIYGGKTKNHKNVNYKRQNRRGINKRRRILRSCGEKFLTQWIADHGTGRSDYIQRGGANA